MSFIWVGKLFSKPLEKLTVADRTALVALNGFCTREVAAAAAMSSRLIVNIRRFSDTEKLELLVDLWRHFDFLPHGANRHRHCAGNALHTAC